MGALDYIDQPLFREIVNILSVNTFIYIYTIVGYVEFFVIIVSFFMVTYKKDGKGLHDMIAGTNVIEEVKK